MPKLPTLLLSDNAKTKFKKNRNNTFGLMYGRPEDGGTCPRATVGSGGCCSIEPGRKRATCYVAKITAIYKGVGNRLLENTKSLQGKTQAEMEVLLKNTVQAFVDKNEDGDLYFRLHWSGDFWSEEYAKAWANTMIEFPQVKFWVYTRSHEYVQHLCEAPNCAVYLSIDPVNKDSGYKAYEQFKDRPNVGLAFMGNTAPLDKKFIRCPEISGKVKSTAERGACSACKLCFTYTASIKLRNIQFPIH